MNKLDKIGSLVLIFVALWMMLILPTTCRAQDTTKMSGVIQLDLGIIRTDTVEVIILYFSPENYGNEQFVGYTAGYELTDHYGDRGGRSITFSGQPKYYVHNWEPFPMRIYALALRRPWVQTPE